MRNFSGHFDSRFIDGRKWLLLSRFSYRDEKFGELSIPQITRGEKLYGFVTDGASIPRFAWPIIGTPEQFDMAAVIHDYLYCVKCFSRRDCDEILRRALLDMDCPKWKAEVMFCAVRLFGGSVWDRRGFIRIADCGEDFAEIVP